NAPLACWIGVPSGQLILVTLFDPARVPRPPHAALAASGLGLLDCAKRSTEKNAGVANGEEEGSGAGGPAGDIRFTEPTAAAGNGREPIEPSGGASRAAHHAGSGLAAD